MRRPLLLLWAATAALLSPGLAAQDTDARHYKLEIDLDFNTATIQGRNTATFRSLVGGLTTLDLDLTSALTVSAVRMQGQPVPFTRPSDRVHITLDRPYNQGEDFTVEIDYGGRPPSPAGFGGLVFTTHNGAPIAWTLSEPWDARTWWPGKDVLVDKATFEIWITHPDTMIAVSNGTLQGIDPLPGGRARSRWQENHPTVAYLASLAVTNYRRRTDTYTHLGANMPVEFYVFPESWNRWQTGMNRVVPMLTAFANVFGQYPFVDEKYGIAQFTWGGGMEHQTVSSQYNVSESLTAHELAHQWWGDEVTCATWSDIWLNEGFATFAEAVWYEQKAGGSLSAYLSAIQNRRPSQTSGTVYVYNPTSTGAIFSSNYSYRKGAWVLHQLRGVLGDPAFFQALRDYRAAYAGSSATTADFEAVCEQSSGRNLDWFFDQWVMRGGEPTYVHAWTNSTYQGRNYLYLELDQVQSSQPLFLMPVRVRVQTAAGTEEHVVWDDQRQDHFVLPLAAPALSVQIDPDEWILRSPVQSRSFTRPFFGVTPEVVDATVGADVEYHIDHGPTGAGRWYLVALGMSGTSPGTNVFGLQVPINSDWFTQVALAAVNSPTLVRFLDYLDANGRAVATFRLPASTAALGLGATIHGAYLFADGFDYASPPVRIEIR